MTDTKWLKHFTFTYLFEMMISATWFSNVLVLCFMLISIPPLLSCFLIACIILFKLDENANYLSFAAKQLFTSLSNMSINTQGDKINRNQKWLHAYTVKKNTILYSFIILLFHLICCDIKHFLSYLFILFFLILALVVTQSAK